MYCVEEEATPLGFGSLLDSGAEPFQVERYIPSPLVVI